MEENEERQQQRSDLFYNYASGIEVEIIKFEI